MFIQPCFIRKNTPELRNKLKELGYKCNNGKWMGAYLATFKRDNDHDLFYCGTPEYDLKNNPSLNYSIDCGTNERLFLAIAAIRNDTDKYQWFVNKYGVFCKCLINRFIHFNENEKLIEPTENTKDWHKATVEELIEYFKDK